MNSRDNLIDKLFMQIARLETPDERITFLKSLKRKYDIKEDIELGFVLKDQLYKARHDIFLTELARFLEIPMTTDVTVTFIEEMLSAYTGITTKEIDSHIKVTPDLCDFYNGECFLIDAKVQALSRITLEQTYQKYIEAYTGVARKYNCQLKVLVVNLDPHLSKIICYPNIDHKFTLKSTAELLTIMLNKHLDTINWITDIGRSIIDRHINDPTFQRLEKKYATRKTIEVTPWFDLLSTKPLWNLVLNHENMVKFKSFLNEMQYNNFIKDINSYNILLKSNDEYMTMRSIELNRALENENEIFLNHALNEAYHSLDRTKLSFMPPQSDTIKKALNDCELKQSYKYDKINSIKDMKPSQHFLWVESMPKTELLIHSKGYENDIKLARFIEAAKSICKDIHITSKDTVKTGALSLLKVLIDSCDITSDIDKYTMLVNELKINQENIYITEEFGDKLITFSKNSAFKLKNDNNRLNLLTWCKAGKGYKKLKEMNEDELKEYLLKKPKICDLSNTELKRTVLNCWEQLKNNLSREYDQNLTSLHQLDHFLRLSEIRNSSQDMATLIKNLSKTAASGILKDISILFKNAIATANMNKRNSIKYYLCKNSNIIMLVLPSDSILKKHSSIVYCFLAINDFANDIYKYNTEDNIAFCTDFEFVDPLTNKHAKKWLAISKPFRLDKSRAIQLLKSYEQFHLLFSIYAHLFVRSQEDIKYSEENHKEWFNESVALSYFASINITKTVTSITDPSRYIINNCIADYSNAVEYITEKFDPKPKSLFACLLYYRLKTGCLRLNKQTHSVHLRKIQFRESEMINAGIESCEIQGIFNNKLICKGIIDVIIENQTLYYSCQKELHNAAQNLIKLYKTPLEYEYELNNYINRLVNKNDIFKNQGDFSINYDTFMGSLSQLYNNFGENLISLRKDIFRREGFGHPPIQIKNLTSSKSCVKERNIDENFQKLLKKIEESESDEEKLKLLKKLNDEYGTNYSLNDEDGCVTLTKAYVDRKLVSNKIPNYFAVESNRVFDELAKILDEEEESILNTLNKYYTSKKLNIDEITTLDLIFWAILNSKDNLYFTVFAKGQRTAEDREIYQGNYINKLGLYFIEHTYKHLCQIHPDEMISEGGDRKVFKMNAIRKQCYAKWRDLKDEQVRESKKLKEDIISKRLTVEEAKEIQKSEKLSELAHRSRALKAHLESILKHPETLELRPHYGTSMITEHIGPKDTVMRRAELGHIRKDYTEELLEEHCVLSLLEINADQSKWSAKDLTYKFILAISINPILYPEEKLLMIYFLLNYTSKKLVLTDEILVNLLNQRFIKDFKDNKNNVFYKLTNNLTQNYVVISQNWLQGNFNYLSSLCHTAAMQTFSQRLEMTIDRETWGSEYVKVYPMVHSDDNNTAVIFKMNKDGVLYKCFESGRGGFVLSVFFKETLKQFCIHLNDKKTNISRLVKEFISQYNIAGEQCSPWQRVILPILSNSNYCSPMEDIYGLSSHIQEAICHNTPPSIVSLLRSIMHSYIYSAYGMGYEMVNDPCKLLNISREWVPSQIGGTIDVPPFILAIYGPSSNDPWKLKNILIEIYKERSKKSGQFYTPESLDKKIRNLNDEDLNFLSEDKKTFLKFLLHFDPVNRMDLETDENVEIIDPESLRPKVLLRPRSYITGVYLNRLYTIHKYKDMVSTGMLHSFILHYPDTTFCKPNKNSIFSRWCSLKYLNTNFIQSLSLQNRSQLFLDRIIFSKGNLIRQSFIEDYLSTQTMDIDLSKNTFNQGHITIEQALIKIKEIIDHKEINIEDVKSLMTSVLLSNKFLQILLEIDDSIIKEDVIKRTSNYPIKFRTMFHTHEIINPPTKIVKASLYPGLSIKEYELSYKNYLQAEIDYLNVYLHKNKYYKTYQHIFKDLYAIDPSLNPDFSTQLNKLEGEYTPEMLVKVLSKVNDLAFSYLTMYSYKARLVIFKNFCPANHLFINYLIGSNLIDNCFVNISLSNNLVYKKNLDICSVLMGIPNITYYCDIFYSYFNFVESCIKKEYRYEIIKNTLPYLTYKNQKVCDSIRHNFEPTHQSDKKLCLIFMYKFGIELTEEEIAFATDLINGESNIISDWQLAHHNRANKLGPFDVTYRTRRLLVRITGIDKKIDTCTITSDNSSLLQDMHALSILDKIFKKIINDFDFDIEFFNILEHDKFIRPGKLYLKRGRRFEFIRGHPHRAMGFKDIKNLRYMCPLEYRFEPSILGQIYTLDDVKFLSSQVDYFDEITSFEIDTIIRLQVTKDKTTKSLETQAKSRLLLRIKRKMYKKLIDADFTNEIYLGLILWNDFIKSSSLLSSLDTGSDHINAGEIYKLVLDLNTMKSMNSITIEIGTSTEVFSEAEAFFSVVVEDTEHISDISSDITITDYSGSQTSIVTFPFGTPIALLSKIIEQDIEVDIFIRSICCIIRIKNPTLKRFKEHRLQFPEQLAKCCAKITSIFSMFELQLENGVRSNMKYIYHMIIFYCYQHEVYLDLRTEHNYLLHKYNYPTVGHEAEYDESAINFIKNKFLQYTSLEDDKSMSLYKKTLKEFAEHIETFQLERRRFIEQMKYKLAEVSSESETEEEDI